MEGRPGAGKSRVVQDLADATISISIGPARYHSQAAVPDGLRNVGKCRMTSR